MNGVVEGGWGYVIAAYALSWGTWVAYLLLLKVRSRS